jgi:hypothetical protein
VLDHAAAFWYFPGSQKRPFILPILTPSLRVGLAAEQLRCGAVALLVAATPAWSAPSANDMLDLPLEDLLQVEIRSAGKREQQLRDIPASVGSRDSGRLLARVGGETDDGFLVLNAGGYRTDGLDAGYGNMMSTDQLARLDPRMHRRLDGDMDKRDLSLSLSAG